MTQIHLPKRLKSEEGKHGMRSHTLYIKLIPSTLIPFHIIDQYLANLNSKSNLDFAIAWNLNINSCKEDLVEFMNSPYSLEDNNLWPFIIIIIIIIFFFFK